MAKAMVPATLDQPQLLKAMRSLRRGDFTDRLPLDLTGIAGDIAEAFNDVVELNHQMAKEMARIESVVGRDGRITQRATLIGAAGSWSDCIDSINLLIADLTQPTAEVNRVLGAVAKGDLSQQVAVEMDGRLLKGEFLRTAKTVNGMVDQLNGFASEVTRVAREVGTEGKLGGQAAVKGVSGTWKDLTDNVNTMAGNLTVQLRDVSKVATAIAEGDLSKKITVDARGEILQIKDVVNVMVDQLNAFAGEVTRVAREVGTEGKLGGQAEVKGVSGTWKDLTDNVNTMAGNLTVQLRDVSKVATAIAEGDLSKKITVDVRGEILQIKDVINAMVDRLSAFSAEVTRVAREVGTEGKLGGQAEVKEVSGTWKDLTDNVNLMAANLTSQIRNIAEVTTAVANGDLSKKITVDVQGEILELKSTINAMVGRLSAFSAEVTRVAREVGTEGKLGGQAEVKEVSGTWKDLTDNVNLMAANLTSQIRNIAEVTTAVANGDLSKKITVVGIGEILELKNTINVMVDQLNAFAGEVTRVAREVGTEGKLGGQAEVKGVSGTWKDLTDNVNFMAANLTSQVRNIAEVTTAVANGDLSKKITVDVRGEILELKSTINVMVDQLNSFAGEVTRVAREVGTEGRLGGQAEVKGVSGTWKDLTDNVNLMATQLTSQIRNIAEVTTAVANGDLSKKITVVGIGEILELKNTINVMVDQLNAFAGEVTRVAREVGTEGKLGGQAEVKGVSGTWKDLTDNVNFMAANLTSQVRNIAEVTTAVANGDLSKKITVDVQGEILELKSTINVMVDQLNSFAGEVTRVAREVGTEGRLGGQAEVKGVAGVWKNLTDNVNLMATQLTSQIRNIAEVTTAVAKGDLSKKITVEGKGEILELKNTTNVMVDQLNAFAGEVTRVAREVGTDGKLGGQAQVKGVAGVWKDLTDNVNLMAANLTSQVRNIAEVTTAVANGDLSKKVTVDVQGEIFALKSTINVMVDQLNSFAGEVTRVAKEVGTEGKLGGQAQVRGVSGTWKDLTDNVNSMAANLTEQVRGIARVVTAVANGDLKRKLAVEAKGEVAALAETINEMTDTLATFADQVTTVAREVGVEGRLGGQASVPGASGTWKDLTDNVNQLAANLTTQVRAIADVATAVTEGDLTRSIRVEASGEVAVLKDKINEMIINLHETTQRNTEQDWLKSNLARFTGLLQGQRDLQAVGDLILSELAPLCNVQYGVFYLNEPQGGKPLLKLLSGYAFEERKQLAQQYSLRQGLVGQCAYEKKRILLTDVPPDYVRITSGLGSATPLNVVVLPIVFEDEIKAVIELASFIRFSDVNLTFLDQLRESVGIVLNTIAGNNRTEELLKQSRSLTEELQHQQEELQQTNEELQEKAQQLSEQNEEVERRRLELDHAKQSIEQKAEQLELTTRYKSQFLANMSHELRTPLNSSLIMSKQLAENRGGNLTAKQVEAVKVIHGAGEDLLNLINHILDLSKIESGTTTIEIDEVMLAELRNDLTGTFGQLAKEKGLVFGIEIDPVLPAMIRTDRTRLQQVLKNLLSNAFKFTEKGSVELSISAVLTGWSTHHEPLNRAHGVLAFAVKDTGIGIPGDKQAIIFEAFQQADMTTSRRYGGTGLGLSISREIARLLEGELVVFSSPGEGSTFTLYLPFDPQGPPGRAAVSVSPAGRIREAPTTTRRPLKDPAEDPREKTVAQALQLDDRALIAPGDRVLLVVEDDAIFAGLILDGARERGFRVILATDGDSALELAKKHRPDAITLDILLPDMDGWRVLDLLKHDPGTRHIPVHVITGTDGSWRKALEMGAIAYLEKSAAQEKLGEAIDKLKQFLELRQRRLLVVEDDELQRQSIVQLIGESDVEITAVGTAEAALAAIHETKFDCMVLDLKLPDMDGLELLTKIKDEKGQAALPVIVYTAKDLTRKDEIRLRKLAETIVVKDVKSPERLLDETALFLHRVESALPEPKRRMLAELRRNDPKLEGRHVLIVDDDARNIFALTAALEDYKLKVAYSENGTDAIQLLSEAAGQIDVVLMDVMMPDIDGLETIRRIRKIPSLKTLPIIALTAKAMTGDRQSCIEAGASDYIAKPVDIERLLSVMRIWLNR